MSFITGSHDIKRISLGRDTEDLKMVYAFIMTMPGVPINYYGDEIGMRYLHITTKEGGRDRTGARTPMQWNDSKNLGFSENDEPYLPVDDSIDAPTVEKQEQNEDSLLNFVKALLALRKAHFALWADGTFRTVLSGYPVVYERRGGDETVRIAINATNKIKNYEDKEIKKILFSYGASLSDQTVALGSRSCVIYTI